MVEKRFNTPKGVLHYWTSTISDDKTWLVFLPGLTADHRLFEKQISEFEADYNLLVWDGPGHGSSRPFELSFSLAEKAEWLYQIMILEGVNKPVIIGQSMGGYVAQALMERYTHCLAGFVSIDSAPLQKKYMKPWEIYALKHTKFMYSIYPWFLLKKYTVQGCAETAYGCQLMNDMITVYTKKEYCALASHGFKILAEAVELDLPYEISCPALLICGEKDRAGYTKRYNRVWANQAGFPIQWIPDAGHNSNTDRPELVNHAIRAFLKSNGL